LRAVVKASIVPAAAIEPLLAIEVAAADARSGALLAARSACGQVRRADAPRNARAVSVAAAAPDCVP
jgi:hypothetical protein